MTLIKSLLLGSAAGIVAVASAQAADLPTKKGAPAAEYVRVCTINVGGAPIVGWTLPGSDTCLKISGYLTGQVEGGNLNNTYNNKAFGPDSTGNLTSTRPSIGYSTRGQVNFDAVSNTGAGPLLAHIELQGNSGVGFDALGNGVVINSAFLTWAGITAGKHGSFYDYLAGGDTWKDFYSPDHSGGPINLLAYTASFGGGASVTLSAEQPEVVAQSSTALGVRSPDWVLALDLSQGWGGAHIAGVAHNSILDNGAGSVNNSWGYGIIGGLTFNIPSMAGDKLALQAAYTKGATGYSGVQSPSWGEGDSGANVNGNGWIVPYDDAVFVNGGWTQPTAWTAAAQLTLKVSPSFEIDPEVSYGSYSISNMGSVSGYWVGAVWDWTAAKNLDFALDTIYMNANIKGANGNPGPVFGSNPNGFNVRLRITRSF
jgi:hypothetical protein